MAHVCVVFWCVKVAIGVVFRRVLIAMEVVFMSY